MVLGIDQDLVIPDKRLSVYEGAVAPWKGEKLGLVERRFYKSCQANLISRFIKPIIDLTTAQYNILWKGNEYVEGINDFFKEVEQNLIQSSIPCYC